MIRSLLISALILIAAALLGWREKQQLSVEKEANEKILRQIANDPSIDPQAPINIERRKVESAKREKVRAISRDIFDLYLRIAANDLSGIDVPLVEADLKSRMDALNLDEIKLFMEECNSDPDLNEKLRGSLSNLIQIIFIPKYPIEMARMMTESPEQFGISAESRFDPYQYLVYYYSAEKKDLQIVFQSLSEAPPEFQAKYIGLSTKFGTESPSQRAELLEEMRYFAVTPEQQELVNGQLGDLAFGRPDVKGSFIELTDWIGSANLSSNELVAATKGMQDKVRVSETAQWLDWLAKNDMPDDVSKQRAFELASKWTEKDYQAVGQWLNRSTDSPEKAAVASAYAAKTYPYDPENAMKWIQTLPQGADRNKALEAIYQGIRKNENYDREAVEAFAREHGLEE
jgi:hypothetical protein